MNMLANIAAAFFAALVGFFAHDLVTAQPAAPHAMRSIAIRLQVAPAVMPVDSDHRFAVASRTTTLELALATKKHRGIFASDLSVRRNPGPVSTVSERTQPMYVVGPEFKHASRSIKTAAGARENVALLDTRYSPRAIIVSIVVR